MQFSLIRPYIRYARAITLSTTSLYPANSVPYDARLFYTVQGSGVITVCGHPMKMKKGTALIINSGVDYTIKAPSNSVTYIACNFDYVNDSCELSSPVPPATKKTYAPSKLISHVEFDNENERKLNTFLYVENAAIIEKKALLLVSEYKKKLFEHHLVLSSLMSEILVDLLRIENMPTLSKEGVARLILEYIDEHYAEPLTNASIASHFGFHPNYLSSLIKKAVGMPLHQYLLRVRLLHAAGLLESGQYSVSDISEKVGFCDVYHFSRFFKKVMGTTPSEFVKGNLKET